MSSSASQEGQVIFKSGDLLTSKAQTLVNTVNCVGVMGKGIALAFKRKYPRMYDDYVARCNRGEVKLGNPYLYKAADHMIVNFPTKDHWRAVSRLEDIVAGLEFLKLHYQAWGITSLAVPPLGCGNGQLEWEVVGPTLHRHLAELEIPVELYVPHGVDLESDQLMIAVPRDQGAPLDRSRFVEPEWIAVIAILDRLQRQPHHWPVGRIMFQKLVYFATQAGIPTALDYSAGSYGPYAPNLKRMLAKLQNNGLAIERPRGKMLEVRVGHTYPDAVASFRDSLEPWRESVSRTVDLLSRMDTSRAEIAASVHFASSVLAGRLDRRPTASEVVDAVEKWKIGRKPPLTHEAIIEALVVLAVRGWLDVQLDEELEPLVERLILA